MFAKPKHRPVRNTRWEQAESQVAPKHTLVYHRLPRGQYKYLPLNPSDNKIRLLKLPPLQTVTGKRESNIKASLIDVFLEKAPKYEALSYRWGDPNELDEIFLDGHSTMVGRTVKSALQRLRPSTRTKLVWVDATCINQKDHKERNEQVSKMRTIYFYAAGVVVWLGEGTVRSPLAFSLLSELHDNLGDRKYIRDLIANVDRSAQWYALRDLFCVEYWGRVWVIQEVNYARSITLRWGSASMRWEDFVAVQEILRDVHHRDLLSAGGWLDLASFFRRGEPRKLTLPCPETDSAVAPDLFKALLSFRGRNATDPRDMVYALVGLTSARDDPLMVMEYSQSVRQVYINVVDYVLSRFQNLDIICAGFPAENIYQLPSWTPDWSNFGRTRTEKGLEPLICRSEGARMFSASQTCLAKTTLINERGSLLACGFRVDSVSILGKRSEMIGSKDLQRAVSVVVQWYTLCVEHEPFIHDDAFTRTIVCDDIANRNVKRSGVSGVFREILGRFALFSRRLFPLEPIHSRLVSLADASSETEPWCDAWIKNVRNHIYRRQFFISQEGTIGLCPETYQKGDVIAILLGCAVPVLLRPHEGYYELLGDVYLDGYMYGKAIEDLQAGKFKLEDFELY
jgi:hypothetical protein